MRGKEGSPAREASVFALDPRATHEVGSWSTCLPVSKFWGPNGGGEWKEVRMDGSRRRECSLGEILKRVCTKFSLSLAKAVCAAWATDGGDWTRGGRWVVGKVQHFPKRTPATLGRPSYKASWALDLAVPELGTRLGPRSILPALGF